MPSAENDARPAVIETECVEWAIRCLTRDGDVYQGTAYTSRKQAEDSGDRLAKINGADWWLVSRRVKVTVESDPWTRPIPPGASPGGCVCPPGSPLHFDECPIPPESGVAI